MATQAEPQVGADPTATPESWTRASVLVLVLCTLTWIFDIYEQTTFTIATPNIMGEFGLSRVDIGLLRGVSTWIGLAGGFFMVPLADMFGRRVVISANILAYSLITGLTGFVRSWFQFGAAISLCRIPLQVSQVCGLMVTESAPTRARGLTQGVFAAAVPAGFALCSFISIWVIPALGWRAMYFLGILPAFLIFFVMRYTRESPRYAAVKAKKQAQGKKTGVGYLTAARRYPIEIALATVAGVCFLFPWISWQSWIPTYLTNELGVGQVTSSSWLSVWFVVGWFAYPINGWLTDRFGRRRIMPLFAVPGGLLLMGFGFIHDETAAFLAGALINFLLLGSFGSGFWSLMEMFPTEVRASGWTIAYTIFSAINGLGPLVAGLTPTIGAAFPIYGFIYALLGPIFFFVLPDNTGRMLIDSVGERLGRPEPVPALEGGEP